MLATSVLVACGGGDNEATVVPLPTTLTGHVMLNGTVMNAVVCVDLNSNGMCDSSEPAPAKKGSDGAYPITLNAAFDQEQLKK